MIYNQLGKTGLRVSKMGFGCAPLGNEYGDIDNSEGTRAIHAAIEAGINFFDTSPYYGHTLSEARLGEALRGKRDQLILATKGGRFDKPMESGFDYSYPSIMKMCEESLQRLQTDYLDVYQLHDIEFGERKILEEGIRALKELKKQGKVRFIGVTGFAVGQLQEVVDAHDLDVTLSYCHGNLLNNTMNDQLVPTVKAKGVGLINASVTHMGILTHQGPQPWHPAGDDIKAAGAAAARWCSEQNKSLPELAIQYALTNENVDVTLLGTRTVAELQSSLALLEREIDGVALTAVQAILAPVKNKSWPSGHEIYWESE